MKRKVHDSEISPWQNNPQNYATTRSDAQRCAKAQSRKRRQVRNNEAFNAMWPAWLLILALVFGFMLYIANK